MSLRVVQDSVIINVINGWHTPRSKMFSGVVAVLLRSLTDLLEWKLIVVRELHHLTLKNTYIFPLFGNDLFVVTY